MAKKYIDADKLKAKIKELNLVTKTYDEQVAFINALAMVVETITSLQQEQPEANEIEKALSLQIQAYLTTASDELYAPGKPLYTEEHHEGIHECMKMWQKLHQYYFSTKQEQPEVDLEIRKQIEELANDWHHKGFASDEDCPLCMQDLIDILWYFYELGLNARKEEAK